MTIEKLISDALDSGVFLYLENGELKYKSKKGGFPEDLKAVIKQHKDEVVNYLKSIGDQEEKRKQNLPALERVERNQILPLSFAQQRLWMLDKIEDGSAHYNIPSALKLTGNLDVQAANQAFTSILERHETLRTSFTVDENGHPVQTIHATAPFVASMSDLSGLSEKERNARLKEIVTEEAGGLFNLSSDLMLRAQLIKLASDQHILLVTMHHIASDGWSMSILINEFSALYGAYSQDKGNPLPPLSIQYADYAFWQRNWLQGEVLEQQFDYWDKQLASLPVVHSLPLDRGRAAKQSFAGDTYASRIEARTSQTLNQLCQVNGASLFMGLHAVFSALLSRYSNETDIVIGTPVANRGQAEIAGLIGFFVNTLVLRSDLSGEPSFNALLNQSKEMLLDAYAHQQVPFEQIVERLQPDRDLSYSPLFQILMILHNNAKGTLDLPGLQLDSVEQKGPGIAKYDLTLEATENDDGLWLHWEYNTDLFERSTIVRMAEHFELLLKAMVAMPDENLYTLDIITPQERQTLLADRNATEADFPDKKCVHELFEAQVHNNSDAVAVIFEGRQLTYGELNKLSNQLAHYLIAERQIGPGSLVGICVDRSLDMLVGILAILKAGGAYVPLDPQYPRARLAYMLNDAELSTVLTQNHLRDTLPVPEGQAVFLDDAALQERVQHQSAENTDAQVLGLTLSELAYVIYTSGSTGNPKGVMVEHGNLVNFLNGMGQQPGLTAQDCLLAVTSTSFDIHGLELFLPLTVGARLVIASTEATGDPQMLKTLLNQHQVSVMQATPVTWKMLLEAGWQAEAPLKALCGGEALSLQLATALLEQPKLELWNMYGPTETTIWSTTQQILPRPNKVLIGKPITNTQVYITSSEMELVPIGVAGELLIGGEGVTRGYLNRPELTDEKFISNPFSDKNDSSSCRRLYKTGDLVRWSPDGNLEYLGRIDHQVKVRGFRIELGEIENRLASYTDVKDAVVLAKASPASDDQRLVAYVVAGTEGTEGGHESSATAQQELISALRHHLSQTLPDYMVPSAFVFLAELPLTPNGKIDRKALPEPDASAQQAIYIAPRTDTEKLLCDMWQDILGVAQVGVTDNFFQLGGHSLLATRLVARIKQALNLDFPLKVLFSSQTLEELAKTVAQLEPDDSCPPLVSVSRSQNLPASYAQQRLWLLDKIDGGSAHYNIPGALKLTGTLDVQSLNHAFTTIVERHESLRTYFVADEEGQPVQVVQAATQFVVSTTDLSDLEERERQLKLMELVTEDGRKVFDLGRDLMLRAHLIKLGEDDYIVLVTMHHIASDGWSMSILINEFCALYSAGVEGRGNPLPPLSIQYSDYAHWQRNWLCDDVLDQQLDYWTTQLAGLPVVHRLPLDHPRPPIQTFLGKTHLSHIDSGISDSLKSLCQQRGATLFMGLQAVFSVLLSRYSNETDIVMGSPIANREQEEVAGLIGFFVNTLVLRSDLSANPSFTGLLQQSKDLLLEAYAHQQVPFEQIVERIQPQRSQSHSPLFQVMLVLQNNEEGTLELPGLRLAPVEQGDVSIAKYDITLNVFEGPQGLSLGWESNTDLFEHETIVRMATHFELLLNGLLAKPEESVFKAEMLDVRERTQLLARGNTTKAEYAKDQCIHQLFEAQSQRHPDAIAVTFEDLQLSYGELNRRANQLAHYLIDERQLTPETLVGICVERSLHTVVGILAILKAGGAYVPLDPQYPEARLAYMLDDAKLTTVLTQSHLRASLPVTDAQAVNLDDQALQEQVRRKLAENPDAQALSPNHLAYIIYTSGSTGKPKGVMVEHQNVTRLLDAARENFVFDATDVWTMFHSYAFDFSVWELWGALAQGARLVVVPYWISRSPSDFYQLLLREKVTVLNQTPSAFTTLMHEDAQQQSPLALRYVVFGGEALNLASLKPWIERHGDRQPQLINMYGITETTVHVTYREITREVVDEASGASLIGQPLADLQLLILNEHQALVPVGVVGEMYIGGAGVTRGYLNQPALTQSRFVELPQVSGHRFYRTGDLARYLPDGELEYLGRIDHQVKIRGFRIELGEIEHVLNTQTDVKEAIVLAKESADGDSRLVSYVVTDAVDLTDECEESVAARQALIEKIRGQLTQALPSYMMPSAFVLLDRLPLTPNGKVDRKALPEPDVASQQEVYVAPRTETEQILCDIWQDVLGVERVGITDNFFQLGGHSLLVMKLLRMLESRLGVSALDAGVVFEAPVLKTFANYLAVLTPRSSAESLQLDDEEKEVFQL